MNSFFLPLIVLFIWFIRFFVFLFCRKLMTSDYEYVAPAVVAELLDVSRGTGVAVVDMRDTDRQEGGWINGSIWFPSQDASKERYADLLESLRKSQVHSVVFHCMFSQARGPKAARTFSALFPPHVRGGNMKVMILEGGIRGFLQWAQTNNRRDLITVSDMPFY